jgi:two-component system, LytTR family, sensor kinase
MRCIISLLLLLNGCPVFSQNKVDTASSSEVKFDGRQFVDLRKAPPEQLKRLHGREGLATLPLDGFWGVDGGTGEMSFPRVSLAYRFQENTGANIYEGNYWQWGTLSKRTILIGARSSVEVIDVYITPENAKDYRYRIIQNDNKELVSWTIPGVFKQTKDKKATYCLLANIPYQEKQFIQVEIYNIKNYKDRDAIIIDWRKPRALEFGTTVDYRSRLWRSIILSASLGNEKISARVNFLETVSLKDIRFRLGDSLVRIGFRSMHLPTPYNYGINLKRTIDGKTESIELGEHNGTFFLYKEFWNKPGLYEITFTPKLVKPGGRHVRYLATDSRSFKFTVLPSLTTGKWFSDKELVLMFVVGTMFFGAITGGLVIWLKRKNRKKVLHEQLQKDLAKTQLALVRSQLNPHFMFNALAGIENLMHKQKTAEANHYLRMFARLTRSVLNNKDLISLEEEKDLLEDYLQMEQLRFGFSYHITIAEKLDINNIEIPAMLLQPFVENAVKHGISAKKEFGNIVVSFLEKDLDLILKIEDNGEGFDVAKNYTGLGLELSRNRISLLNTIYQGVPFVLTMDSGSKGSAITITLTQWL